MDKQQHILLFETCQLTRGASRTLLTDLQRAKIEFLDNGMYPLLSKLNREKNIAQLLAGFDAATADTVEEYFRFLLDNEYAFLCKSEELSFFPPMSKEWDHPAFITNCIIDTSIESSSFTYLKRFIDELDQLGCENVQIRDFEGLSAGQLDQVLMLFNQTAIFRIELLVKFSGDLKGYQSLLAKYPRINELIIHSCDFDLINESDTSQHIMVTKQVLSGKACCGVIRPGYFNLSLEHYLESLQHNTCLNRKIAVDSNGQLKNCPSMQKEYGHVSSTSLKQLLTNPDFIRTWKISKNEIDTCKVCEFRNICTDCRAYLDSDTALDKPAKCSYDPITMQWQQGSSAKDLSTVALVEHTPQTNPNDVPLL